MPDLIEHLNAAEAYATRLARIDKLGPCSRLVFAAPAGWSRDNMEQVVVYVILPTSELAAVARHLLDPTEAPAETGELPPNVTRLHS